MSSTEQPEHDLDALIARARIEAQRQRSSATAQASVVRLLADAGGSLPLAVLLSRGAPRDVVAELVAEPTDKRQRAKARLAVVGSEPAVWLTATGFQSVGRQAKEKPPTTESLAHSLAPQGIAQYIAERQPAMEAAGLRLTVSSGPSCSRFSEQVVAQAWALLRSTADAEGSIGSCTGGVVPDALITERYSLDEAGSSLYARCWPDSKPDLDDLAETTVAVEVQDSRMADEPLRHRVEKWSAAVESLRAARAVLWVVRSQSVALRLAALGVGDHSRRPGQLLVPAHALGLGGQPFDVQRPWWVTAVPVDQATADRAASLD